MIEAWDRFFSTHFHPSRLMAILRGLDESTTVALCRQAHALGVTLIEVPIQSAAARPSFLAAVEWARESGAVVGAGTVLDVESVQFVAQSGGAFTVAPGVDKRVVRESARLELPHLPGVASGSEIQQARRLGCHWLKVFPASELGEGWVRAMRGPFPDIRLVMTGGMTAGNALGYLDAGADAVALGTAFAHATPEELTALRATSGDDRGDDRNR